MDNPAKKLLKVDPFDLNRFVEAKAGVLEEGVLVVP
jgi:hypothetical protein